MYYVIENEYTGPNQHNIATDHKNIVNGHFFEVRTEPGRKNMSKEAAVGSRAEPIWLGSSNDWDAYAWGEYETEEEAISVAITLASEAGHGFRFVEAGEPGAEDGFCRAYVGDEAWSNVVDAAEWLQELSYEELGIHQGMTDLEIERLAEDLEAVSLDADECRLWGTEEFIRERIKELEEDLEVDQAEE